MPVSNEDQFINLLSLHSKYKKEKHLMVTHKTNEIDSILVSFSQ